MHDDPLIDVLQATVAVLDEARITYAVTGSVASAIHGEPFQSQDVDFVLRMTESQAAKLAAGLPQRFYRSSESLMQIARDGGLANLIDAESGLKVDLSVVPDTPFFRSVFSRRQKESYGPQAPSFFTVTAEDVILMKLVWRIESRSPKQWENALSVAQVKGARMDWKYLFTQAEELGIVDDLTKLRDEAGI